MSEMKHIEKQIVKWQLVGAGGGVVLALGLYGMFGVHGHVFYKPLANKGIAWSLLAVGVAVVVWQYRKTYSLVKELARLRQREDA